MGLAESVGPMESVGLAEPVGPIESVGLAESVGPGIATVAQNPFRMVLLCRVTDPLRASNCP